jgi:hypothetical protein
MVPIDPTGPYAAGASEWFQFDTVLQEVPIRREQNWVLSRRSCKERDFENSAMARRRHLVVRTDELALMMDTVRLQALELEELSV